MEIKQANFTRWDFIQLRDLVIGGCSKSTFSAELRKLNFYRRYVYQDLWIDDDRLCGNSFDDCMQSFYARNSVSNEEFHQAQELFANPQTTHDFVKFCHTFADYIIRVNWSIKYLSNSATCATKMINNLISDGYTRSSFRLLPRHIKKQLATEWHKLHQIYAPPLRKAYIFYRYGEYIVVSPYGYINWHVLLL